ncbi:MAG: hypothetical protein HYX65_12315 [Gemmatimonadetes bacterium]|nr:hypothetical protein [Gemmatimonadota bacterium]
MIARVGAALLCLAAAGGAAGAQRDRLRVDWGLHGSWPEYVSASFGVSRMRTDGGGEQRGFFVAVEPGLNGGRISVGQRRGFEDGVWSTHFGLLHTWNAPQDTRPGVTYLGTEQRVTFAWFEVGLGFGYRVAGGEPTTPFGGLTQRGVQTIIITGVLGAHFAF